MRCGFNPWARSVGSGSSVAMSSGGGHRHSSDLILPWLWCRPDSTPNLGTSICHRCAPKRDPPKKLFLSRDTQINTFRIMFNQIPRHAWPSQVDTYNHPPHSTSTVSFPHYYCLFLLFSVFLTICTYLVYLCVAFIASFSFYYVSSLKAGTEIAVYFSVLLRPEDAA